MRVRLCLLGYVVLFLALALLVGCGGGGAVSDGGDEEVVFADLNLEMAVRSVLGITPGQPITRRDMLNLEWLYAPASYITDLSGLEYALNLRFLDLSFNLISDLTPFLVFAI